MKTRDKVIFIAVCLILFCFIFYLVKSVITPFVISLIIAYLLDPLVDRLSEKCRLSRLAATLFIMGLFMSVVAVLAITLLPIIYSQLAALIGSAPKYSNIIIHEFYPNIVTLLNKSGFAIKGTMTELVSGDDFASNFLDLSKSIFDNVLTSSAAIINILSLIFITPILVFYLLKDWDILIGKISLYLPRSISSSTKKIMVDIDKSLSGYVRGQIHVCLILGTFYSILLTLIGLDFGLTIGFVTGLLSFIPYVGALCGISSAAIVALLQWGFDPKYIGLLGAVFIIGQLVESNLLTPKLIGSKVGLHPVWIIFGLFFFGALLGFIGILIAVPLTAICGVVIKHFAMEYKKRFT